MNPGNLTVLRDFESRLFDHLSTAPHIKLLERAERSGKTLERILGENPQKNALKQSLKSGLKPRKIGFPLPKSQLDFESFSLRPLRYISKYIFIENLRFVYRKSALKLGTVAVRILLENASFRQALKPVRTSKLTFPRVIWRHPAKHPLGFRVATSYDHLSNAPYSQYSLIIIAKSRLSVNWKYKKPFPLCLTDRAGRAIFISNLKYALKGEPMAQNRQNMGSGPVKPLLLQLMIPAWWRRWSICSITS